MYVYYKGDDVYRVMFLLALTLQPSHISVDSESLPVPATVIKFIGLRLSHEFVSISARIGFNHGVIYKYLPLGLRISFGIIQYLYGYVRVMGIPAGTGRNG